MLPPVAVPRCGLAFDSRPNAAAVLTSAAGLTSAAEAGQRPAGSPDDLARRCHLLGAEPT